jgi:8-oxo-dGTP pyrophosphatase MutT (NUDIX family)
MTITNSDISDTLSSYLASHPGEHDSLTPLVSRLVADAEVTARSAAPGHVTCGAVVINDAGKILMIHHNVLDRWLLPGGHLETTDPGLLAAALRELAEETGVSWQEAVSPPGLDRVPLDIDLHQIPANPAKGEPAHWHADFRFAFLVTEPAISLQVEEVSAHAWRPPSSLQTERLAAKVTRLSRSGAPRGQDDPGTAAAYRAT